MEKYPQAFFYKIPGRKLVFTRNSPYTKQESENGIKKDFIYEYK